MSVKIALAGNPNSGKTTLFNDLTGSAQYVGNWPGVTVEKKEGKLKGRFKDVVVDLPGIYSLSPYTPEERVTRDFLIYEKPDVIIDIVDATNLERNLYLTTQLVEVGIPVVVALNMMDIVEKNGDIIDVAVLSKELGCEVVEISALKGTGTKKAADKAIAVAANPKIPEVKHTFSPDVEAAITAIEELLREQGLTESVHWQAVKLFERDEIIRKQLALPEAVQMQIEQRIAACEKTEDDEAESLIANQRYLHLGKVIQKALKKKSTGMTLSDKIDRIVTNRWLALPIFALVMWAVYFIAVTSLGSLVTGWTSDVLFGQIIAGNLSAFLNEVGAAAWLQSLLIDGVIGGVGSVLGFLPQIMLLFFLISLLEDCGYMARVAFIMDRLFRRFGLSGKSFIPMLIGTGCSVPAIMAGRTIENDKDRKMTIILTPFIPCSAKLPIFALMAGVFFPTQAWVAPSMYFLGIAMVVFSGLILKRTPLFAGEPSPFVMEMPQYHLPSLKNLLIHLWDKVKGFVVKAGTIIFAGATLIWFLQSFNGRFQMVDAGESILAAIGSFIAPVFAPLGFGNWQSTVATMTGVMAKETVVATFGVLFGVAEVGEKNPELMLHLSSIFTAVSAYSFMTFNLLASPCIAAISAMRRELGSWKWTFIAIGYQMTLAYVVSLLIFQIGSAVFLGTSPLTGILVSAALIGALTFIFINDSVKKRRKINKSRISE